MEKSDLPELQEHTPLLQAPCPLQFPPPGQFPAPLIIRIRCILGK
jgi:hypothetical protein